MANDYRILDERDIKNFQAGNKLEVTEIGNKVTYEHIGEPPNTLPSQEEVLEYGESFNITVPSVYDSTGHVKSETKYSFIMPEETDTSNFLTIDNFGDKKGNPVTKSVDGNTIIYSHSTKSLIDSTPESATQLTYGGTFEIPALSAADGYGHATEQKTYKFQMPTAVNVSGYLTKDSFGYEEGNPVTKDENGNTIIYSHKKSGINSTPTPTTITPDNNTISLTVLSAADAYGHATTNTKYQFTVPSMPSKIELAGGVTGAVSDLDSKKTWKLDTEVDYYHKYMEESYEMTTHDPNWKTYITKEDISKTHFLYIVLTPPTGWVIDTSEENPYMIPGQLTFLVPTTKAKSFKMPILLKKTEKQDINITIDGTNYSTKIDKETITSDIRTVSFQYTANLTDPSKSSLSITSPYKFDGVDIFGF